MSDGHDLLEVIRHIDPAACSYEEWVQVGMALKDAGHDVAVWESWSRRDAERHRDGECVKKWQSFRGSANPVTGGTVVALARAHGWSPSMDGGELSWDSVIGPHDEHVVVKDPAWIEDEDVPEPAEWDPARELITYLETLFESGENVGYVAQAWEREGRFLPKKGNWDRTAGELIDELSRCGGDLGRVIGDVTASAGAWIRFNPLDGRGVKNENVAEFRYALVESDTQSVGKQYAIYKQLELPIAAVVHSGGKSLHAIVRIDAPSYDEYRKRVDYLYDVCKKNGLSVDAQNKNPSRLSRMPGVMRDGHKQHLVAVDIGKESWAEWHDWIDKVNDDLPEPESLESVWDDLPELSAPLIEGVLRQGHKLLLAGPSKAGKSFALIELAIAIAEGRDWLGMPCAKGRVLYVNLELDRASCLHRFKDVYEGLGWAPEGRRNVHIWNLRGKAVPMDRLAPKLIRRAQNGNYIAVIIDPIYKVITGDENSAHQMAEFSNQFDLVASKLGCSVIYCHHHSKGAQGQKRSADRASGSGVFARDPDTLLDLIELDLNDDIIKQQINSRSCAAITRWLDERGFTGWRDDIPQDAWVVEREFRSAVAHMLGTDRERMNPLIDELAEVEKAVRTMSAWRIEGTLREFPKFPPIELWFDYPRHHVDESGVLKDLDADGVQPIWQKGAEKRKKAVKKERASKLAELERAVAESNFGEPPTQEQIAEFLGTSKRTATRRIREHGGFTVSSAEDGYTVRRKGLEGPQ